jgi:predicted RNA-binding Zn-ribbon protein involved in translation (DUF1610 family)
VKPNKKTKIQTLNNQFPCKQCGAMIKYHPGSQHQTCEYCDFQNEIVNNNEVIKENDFHHALSELAQAKPIKNVEQAHCKTCGASFKFAASVHAGECPFCGTDIVINPQQSNFFSPKSLLPFYIDEAIAKEKFKKWLDGLWFAPNQVKKYARSDTKLVGIYLPYWTYDSETKSSYIGERGDTYYVQERVSYVRNGRRVSGIKRVPKIRWTHVRGFVSRFFDDVLIGASFSLPRQILDHLEPWDLEQLVPYDEKYISGFQSEIYQLGLDEGFDQAKQVMDDIIYRDIAYDIGGNHQRIHQVKTTHSDTTYKHCLLPIWSAAFSYKGKPYRFVINGRTGEVQGERPYSFLKIALAIFFGLIVIVGVNAYLQESESGIDNHLEFTDYYAPFQE